MLLGEDESPSSRIFFSAKRARKSLPMRASVEGWLDWGSLVEGVSVLFEVEWDLLLLDVGDFRSDGKGGEMSEDVFCHDPLELVDSMEDMVIAEWRDISRSTR